MKSISKEIRTRGLLLLMVLAAGCSNGSGNSGNAIRSSLSGDDSRAPDASKITVRTTERDHGLGWESERNSQGNSHGYPSDTH
jgi:hypothetical protein